MKVRCWVLLGGIIAGCGSSPPPPRQPAATTAPATSTEATEATPTPEELALDKVRPYGFRSGVVEYDWRDVGPGRPERSGHGTLSFDDWGRKHAERNMPADKVTLWTKEGIVTYLPAMNTAMRFKLPQTAGEKATHEQLSQVMAQLPTSKQQLPQPSQSSIAGEPCQLYHLEQVDGPIRGSSDSCIAHGLMLLLRTETITGNMHILLEQRATSFSPNVQVDPALFDIPVPIEEMPTVTDQTVRAAQQMVDQYQDMYGEGGAGP